MDFAELRVDHLRLRAYGSDRIHDVVRRFVQAIFATIAVGFGTVIDRSEIHLHRSLSPDIAPACLTGENLGKPPVHHQHLTKVSNHHIRRFQIAMQNPLRMRERDGVTDLQKNVEELGEGIVPLPGLVLPDQLLERTPLHHLHGEIEVAILILSQFVDGNDVGVFQLTRDLRLLQKMQTTRVILRILLPHHLHRDRAPDGLVGALDDVAHPALADLPQRFVALGCYPGFIERLMDMAEGGIRGFRFLHLKTLVAAIRAWNLPMRERFFHREDHSAVFMRTLKPDVHAGAREIVRASYANCEQISIKVVQNRTGKRKSPLR